RQLLKASAFATIGALAVVGCAAPKGPAPTSLTVLALAHPVSACAALIEQHAMAAAKDAGVTLRYSALDATTLRQRLAEGVQSKQLPDLALVGAGEPPSLAQRGLLYDLRPLLDRLAGLNGPLFLPFAELAANGPAIQN